MAGVVQFSSAARPAWRLTGRHLNVHAVLSLHGRHDHVRPGVGAFSSPETSGEPAIEAQSRYRWSCLIDGGGNLEEFEDTAGVEFVRSVPALIGYARALLASERDQLIFHLVPDAERWFAVSIARDVSATVAAQAVVEVQAMAAPFDMTLRELDVLTLVAAGFSNENIAARLEISVRTVAKHVENIFRKTEVWSRAGLAGLAADRGLVRLPTPGGLDGYPLATGEIERLAASLDQPAPERQDRPRRATVLRPLLIGLPFAESGRGVADSVEILNGAELAVSEINARGGLLGRQVEIVAVPYESGNRDSVLAAYDRIIGHEVDAITAGYSCYLPEAHDLVGDYGAPFLHAATMRSAVDRVRDSHARLGNIFQTCASDVTYGLGIARFLRQIEQQRAWRPATRRICIVQPPWPGFDIGIDQMDRVLAAKGWAVDILPVGTGEGQDWCQTVAALHRLNPSVVVLASYFVDDAIGFQRAFAADPLPALVYGIYGPSVPAFRSALGPLSEGVVWATTTGVYADAIGENFRRRYQKRFRQMPGHSQAGLAYDRINLLAGAWSRTGRPRRFADVVTELRSSISRGVNGAYFLGNEGQVGLTFPDDTTDPSISQAHLVFQVQDGENVILAPTPYAHAGFRVPDWFRTVR